MQLKHLSVAALFSLFASTVSAQDRVDFSKYMQSAPAVSAIAAAIASVQPCAQPLEFYETKAKGKLSLGVNCPQPDNESGVVVNFDVYGDTILVQGFQYAG